MDFDLEIIGEEGDRQDPLFDSIMNAMNSMKEATADKIYQKIQKDGITNYSKPQVDRALANALKYGIFEVRNNRYRIRDDILDDEDTVYWRLQKKRNQTPFRIEEASSDKHLGPKLDPEKDNQRFRKLGAKLPQECPHCGRVKRPQPEEAKAKSDKKSLILKASQKPKRSKKDKTKSKVKDSTKENPLIPKGQKKRKEQPDKNEEKSLKRRKSEKNKFDDEISPETSEERLFDCLSKGRNMSQEASDTSSSEMDMISQYIVKGQLEKSTKSSRGNSNLQTSLSSENNENLNVNDAKLDKRSCTSVKSESDSEKTYMSSASDDQSQSRSTDKFFDEFPCTSRNASVKARNQYLTGDEMYSHYQRDQNEQRKENSDWLGCSEEPQGTIIQSNNVLTIEPMDSLALKSPEPASYIS